MQTVDTENKRKSVFLPWFSSYVATLIVPILVSSFIYAMSGKIIKDETIRANSSFMKQLQEVMDGYLRSVEKISMEIGFNDTINGLLNLKEEPNEYHQYEMIKMINELKLYKAANPFIDYLCIYFDNNDFTLSHNGKNDSQIFYEFYHENPKVSYEDWMKSIQSSHVKDYVPMIRRESTGAVREGITFMQSLPVRNMTSRTGTLAIMLDMDQIMNLLQNSIWTNVGTLLILDENNAVVAATASMDSLPEALSYENLDALPENINSRWKNEDVVVSSISSNTTKWKYVSIIPRRIFYSKAKFIQNITVISTLLCLIVGSMIAYAFTKKNYNPLKRLVQVIRDKENEGTADDSNEYGFITDSILNTIKQKNEAYQKLKNQNSLLKNNFLLKFLKGTFEKSIPVEEAITNYDIKFYSDFFSVMLFDIEDYGIFDKGDSDSVEGMKLARLVVENVAGELIDRKNHAFMVEEDDILACIVNFEPEYAGSCREEMLHAIEESKNFINEKFGIRYTVSLSTLQQGYYGIALAYREAMDAMEYKIVMGSGKVIEYEEIKESSRQSIPHTFSLEVEQRFIDCIKAQDFTHARKIMVDIIDDSFYKSLMPIQITKCLMFSMVNTMINAVKELSILCDKKFVDTLNPVERLLECKTVEEIREQMDMILTTVGAYIEDSSEKRGTVLWKEVIDYIENHYNETSLSVAMLAEHFDCNPSYLSNYFKGKTGAGILEFINRTRINKAKQLLRHSEMSLQEIAEKVGYYSSNTLIRIFKKLEGVTPGKFREKLEQLSL